MSKSKKILAVSASSAILATALAVAPTDFKEGNVADAAEIQQVSNINTLLEGKTARVSWEAVPGATRYRVQTYAQDKTTGEYVKNGTVRTTSTTSIKSATLAANVNYKFEVIPYVPNRYAMEASGISKPFMLSSEPTPSNTGSANVEKVTNVTTVLEGKTARVSWNLVEGAKRYRIQAYVLDSATGEFVKSGGVRTSYTNTFKSSTLQENKVYKFEITPYANNQYVTESAAISNTIIYKVEPPAPVTNIQATLTNKTASITWNAVPGATRYQIVTFVKDDTGEFVKEGTTRTSTTTSVKSATLKEGKTYRFEVTPYVSKYVSESKGTSSSIIVPVTQPPVEENNVVAPVTNVQAVLTNKTASITWNAVPGATRYQIVTYMKNDSGEFVKEGTTRTSSTNSIKSATLKEGKTYRFEITPYVSYKYVSDSKGTSSTIMVPITQTQPPVVEDDKEKEEQGKDNEETQIEKLRDVYATSNGVTANITWAAYANATKYQVQAYTLDEKGEYQSEGSAKTVTTNKLDGFALKEGKTYRFLVTPYVNSRYVNEAAGATISPIIAVSGVATQKIANVKTEIRDTTLQLNWDSFDGATRYRVQAYKKDENGTFKTSGTALTTSSNSYTFIELERGKEYQFVVTPLVNNTYKTASATTSTPITVPLVPPVENVLANVSHNITELTWSAVDGVSQYRVQVYKKDSKGNYTEVTSAARNTSTNNATVPDLQYGATYQFKITPFAQGSFITESFGATEDVTIGYPESPSPYAILEGSTAKVTWEDIPGITKYSVATYKKTTSGTFVKEGQSITTSSTEFTSVPLAKGNSYKFEVTPLLNGEYNTAYAGSSNTVNVLSDSIQVDGEYDDSELTDSKVKNINLTQYYDNIAFLSWNELNGNTRYRVQAYTMNTSYGSLTKWGSAFDVEGTSTVLYGLTQGETYVYEVTAYVEEELDNTSANNSNSLYIPIPNYFTSLDISYNQSTATVSWGEHNEANGYKAQLYKYDSSVGDFVIQSSSAVNYSNAITYYNLESGGIYLVQVTPRIGYVYDESESLTEFIFPSYTSYYPY